MVSCPSVSFRNNFLPAFLSISRSRKEGGNAAEVIEKFILVLYVGTAIEYGVWTTILKAFTAGLSRLKTWKPARSISTALCGQSRIS